MKVGYRQALTRNPGPEKVWVFFASAGVIFPILDIRALSFREQLEASREVDLAWAVSCSLALEAIEVEATA